MKRAVSTLLLLVACVSATYAADPEMVRTHCPAVTFDDHDERGRDVPDGPHPVTLMVVAKVKKLNAPAADGGGAERSRVPRDGVTLIVERTLFGSPPGREVAVPWQIGTYVPKDADQTPYIYALSTSRRSAKPAFSLNGYYSYDRIYPLDQEPYARALGQARLDLQVLSAAAIIVARPAAQAAKEAAREVTVERSLYGEFRPGQRIKVSGEGRHPPPPDADDSSVYLLDATNRVQGHWSVATIDAVQQSLGRRDAYPVRETQDASGAAHRSREIVFSGSRADAIAMLGSPHEVFQILAARRLVPDGAEAVSDVLAAIQQELWSDKRSPQAFLRQANLVRMLGILEEHRPDGHAARLIDGMLSKAEQGAGFPGSFESEETDVRRNRRGTWRELSTDSNHSLGWLLLTLDTADAARLFGTRLVKLRDSAQDGWQDEARFVLDNRKLEDQLTLAKIEPASRALQPVTWLAGRDGEGHGGRIESLEFVDNDTLRTSDLQGKVLHWDVSQGSRRKSLPEDRQLRRGSEDRRERATQDTFVAEDGQTWQFVGQNGGKYDRFTSFEIRVTKRGSEPTPNRLAKPGPDTATLGEIRPQWGQYHWLGLVPGGQWLHIGTQVFARDNLEPVSAVNVSGQIDQIRFSADGRRYVLVTSEGEWRPVGLGPGVRQRHETSQRVRVHETNSGETLFALPTTKHVRLVAISPDLRRLAIDDESQVIRVWTLPR